MTNCLKRVVGTVLICALGFCASGVGTTKDAHAAVAQADFNYISLKSGAITIDGESYLPLRATFLALDIQIVWRADGQNKVKLKQGNQSFELDLSKAGDQIVAVGNQYPCHVVKGTSYVPLRFYQDIINRDLGLSGNQMMVIVDNNPTWNANGENTNPMWAQLASYKEPTPQAAPVAKAPPAAKTPAKATVVAQHATTKTVAATKAEVPASVELNPVLTGDALIWPMASRVVTSPFGMRVYPIGDGTQSDFHTGCDISGKKGETILAAAAGTVTRAEWFYSYGNCVDITHPSGLVTRYAHLDVMNVAVGDQLAQGQALGIQGMTGAATGPHLHFETRINDKAVDPKFYLK